MTAPTFVIDADALHAFVDGQLDDRGRAAVQSWLASHPEAAADIDLWRRQNDALAALYPPLPAEATPQHLRPEAIVRTVAEARRHGLRNVAAALILVVLGGAIGWSGRDYLVPVEAAPDRLIDEAVSAHALYVKEQTHAVEVSADAPNLMRWLSNRIATPIDAPDLSAQGFAFLGGRLLPGDYDGRDPTPAAQLMYQNAAAQRLTLYITGPLDDRKEVWKFEARNGIDAYYWANDRVTCTIVSDLPEADIRTLGKTVFEQLTRHADSAWNPKG